MPSTIAKQIPDDAVPQPVDLGAPESTGAAFQILQGMQEAFARSVSAGLTQFLQTEIQVSLSGIRLTTVEDFLDRLTPPSCLVNMRLHPGFERAILRVDCPTALSLLELLLGGTPSSVPATARELTEIEWNLLEEVSRVLTRHLGEAWVNIKRIEFVVESLGSEPGQLAYPYPSASAQKISFSVAFAGQMGHFELVVPCTFFDAPESVHELPQIEDAPVNLDVERNASLLGDAEVELEVHLKGVQLTFKELAALREGQIIRLDDALLDPLQGFLNGAPCFAGHVLSAGRKRAFQIEEVAV